MSESQALIAPERDARAELSAALIRCTPKQRRWLRALPDHNFQKWAAGMKLGFGKRTLHAWLRDPKVKAVLALIDEVAVDELEITNRMILRRLKQIAMADMRNLYEQVEVPLGSSADAATGKPEAKTRTVDVLKTSNRWDDDTAMAVIERSYNESGLPKIKLADPLRALDMLAKWRNLIVERHEVTGKDGIPLQPAVMVVPGLLSESAWAAAAAEQQQALSDKEDKVAAGPGDRK